MEHKLKEICLWINDLALLSKTIQQNKMSPAELKALLEMVDIKRKGYLDLSDVYELVGKVTEDELFAIFKFMDTSRTGEIRLEQLECAFGDQSSSSKNTNKEYIFPRFYAIVDTIKDRPRLSSEYKKKYGFTPANLKATYQHISSLMQSKFLTNQELFKALKKESMKFGMMWRDEQQSIIKQLFPDKNVSQSKFLQLVGGEFKPKTDIQEECLLSGIEGENFSSYKEKVSQLRINPVVQNKSIVYQKQSNPSIIYKKTNNFVQSGNESPSFRSKAKQSCMAEQNEVDCGYTKQFDAIEGNINEVLSSIHQRRQKLRQDSLERKKLIDDVMNRKRQFCPSANLPSSPQAGAFRGYEDFSRRIDGISFERDGSKSYLNKTYQKGVSSYKESSHQNSLKNSYRRPEFIPMTQAPKPQEIGYPTGGRSSTNDFKITVERQYSNSIRKDRPFTPLSSQQPKYEINQILKKYNNFGNTYTRARQQEQENNTLKQLCKSKSGFIYSQPLDAYPRRNKEPTQNYQINSFKYQRQPSHSKPAMSKQNVLKRAEEQANRKIEEIERKARMKVLEKKGISKKEEWGTLVKRGCYY